MLGKVQVLPETSVGEKTGTLISGSTNAWDSKELNDSNNTVLHQRQMPIALNASLIVNGNRQIIRKYMSFQ